MPNIDFAFLQSLFLFTMFTDAASALISYFLVNQIAEKITKHKTVATFVSWTGLFFGCVTLIFALAVSINARGVTTFSSLFIMPIEFALLYFPFNLVFIGTWIFGAVLATYETPEGY